MLPEVEDERIPSRIPDQIEMSGWIVFQGWMIISGRSIVIRVWAIVARDIKKRAQWQLCTIWVHLNYSTSADVAANLA
ncbi:predicted protein [Histoplasma mississippiense (nom. inval.)]|uniref:predicted protein n=1 Tax=Ajellomyces capsulatus (strain NAm1 / WU24) TaxID=2059318 RepID=UPI000157D585|nr:predicted protein [Histoplasma mississippiense (nom. inval.)]EDN05322.1 predicted protein [Histoplasma mississippiense (nom. inval.)]